MGTMWAFATANIVNHELFEKVAAHVEQHIDFESLDKASQANLLSAFEKAEKARDKEISETVSNNNCYETKKPNEKERSLASVSSDEQSDVTPAVAATEPAATASMGIIIATLDTTSPASDLPSGNNGKKRRKNKSIDEFKDEYNGEIKTALTKLKDAANNVDNAKLSVEQCCAILWVCLGEFHKNTSTLKKEPVTKLLKDAMAKDPTFSAADYLTGLQPPSNSTK